MKENILKAYTQQMINLAGNLDVLSGSLTTDPDFNTSVYRSMYVLCDAISSQMVLIRGELDK